MTMTMKLDRKINWTKNGLDRKKTCLISLGP